MVWVMDDYFSAPYYYLPPEISSLICTLLKRAAYIGRYRNKSKRKLDWLYVFVNAPSDVVDYVGCIQIGITSTISNSIIICCIVFMFAYWSWFMMCIFQGLCLCIAILMMAVACGIILHREYGTILHLEIFRVLFGLLPVVVSILDYLHLFTLTWYSIHPYYSGINWI